MSRRVDTEKHAVDRRARLRAKCHGNVAPRPSSFVKGHWPRHRQVCSYHDVLDIENAAAGIDLPTSTRIHAGNRGVLKNTGAQRLERSAEADEIRRGIKLRLVPKSQGADGLKWQRSFSEHLGTESNAARRCGLFFDLGKT